MSSSIGLSGALFDTSLTAGNINTIKVASDRDHIGNPATRLWDKVVDWFCGTDREAAKKLVFDLYDPRVTDEKKYDAFQNLRALAGANFTDNFSIIRSDKDVTYKVGDDYTLKLDLQEPHTDPVARQRIELDLALCILEQATAGKYDQQLKADFDRSLEPTNDGPNEVSKSYKINGQPVSDIREFRRFTPEHLNAITAICIQGLDQELAGPIACAANDAELQYDVKTIADGSLQIDYRFSKDVATTADESSRESLNEQINSYEGAKKSLQIQAQIIVSPNGSDVKLVSSEVLSNNRA